MSRNFRQGVKWASFPFSMLIAVFIAAIWVLGDVILNITFRIKNSFDSATDRLIAWADKP